MSADRYAYVPAEWYEALPPAWSWSRLGRHSRIYSGGTPDKAKLEYWEGGHLPWINSGSVNDWVIRSPSAYITQEAMQQSSTRWGRKGSLVIALAGQGKTKGTVARLEADFLCNQSMAVIEPDAPELGRYLQWWLASKYAQIRNLAGGELRDGLNLVHIAGIPVPLPPSETAIRISAFLDRETAQIDELIAKQERLIVLLAERQSVVLTGALSGPESLLEGNTNERWLHAPLGMLMDLQTGLTLGKDVPPGSAVEMPYLRVANVQIGRVDLTEVKTVSVDSTLWRRHQLFAGDVLMTEGGDIDKLGRGSIWGGEIEPCLHQNHVFAIRCGPRLLNRWLEYVLAGPQARRYFQVTAKKSTNLASTNSSVVKAFRVPLPSMEEQIRLVSDLDTIFDGLRDLTEKATEMIALLKERRQALISAAVTGKIDVTGKA